jgi:hypothetical protein
VTFRGSRHESRQLVASEYQRLSEPREPQTRQPRLSSSTGQPGPGGYNVWQPFHKCLTA